MKVSITGSGNVAWHMAKMLKGAGHYIVQVAGRKMEEVKPLAAEVGAVASSLELMPHGEADVYILAVSDESIREIAERLPADAFVVHTSGSAPMDLIPQESRGVMWPLQTLTRGKAVDYKSMPICVEASSGPDLTRLKTLLEPVEGNVVEANSDQRRRIHLAAVIVSNFSNHLYTIGNDLLQEHQLDFGLLKPLILETARKVQDLDPVAAQTGPAVRQDKGTIERHLEMLSGHPDWKAVYQQFSTMIGARHHGQ